MNAQIIGHISTFFCLAPRRIGGFPAHVAFYNSAIPAPCLWIRRSAPFTIVTSREAKMCASFFGALIGLLLCMTRLKRRISMTETRLRTRIVAPCTPISLSEYAYRAMDRFLARTRVCRQQLHAHQLSGIDAGFRVRSISAELLYWFHPTILCVLHLICISSHFQQLFMT